MRPSRPHSCSTRVHHGRVTATTSTAADVDALSTMRSLLAAGGVAVLSGAGLSTESGIPDYRGPTGAPRRHAPMTFQAFTRDPAAPAALLGAQRTWAGARSPRRPQRRPPRGGRSWQRGRAARRDHHAERRRAAPGGGRRATSSSCTAPWPRSCACAAATRESAAALDGGCARPTPTSRRVRPASTRTATPNSPTTSSASFRWSRCGESAGDLLKPDVVFFGESVPARRGSSACYAMVAAAARAAGARLVADRDVRLPLRPPGGVARAPGRHRQPGRHPRRRPGQCPDRRGPRPGAADSLPLAVAHRRGRRARHADDITRPVHWRNTGRMGHNEPVSTSDRCRPLGKASPSSDGGVRCPVPARTVAACCRPAGSSSCTAARRRSLRTSSGLWPACSATRSGCSGRANPPHRRTCAPTPPGSARSARRARLAASLRAWPMLVFEVTEERTVGSDGERLAYVPGRGFHRSMMSANGDVVVGEERLRGLLDARPHRRGLPARATELLGHRLGRRARALPASAATARRSRCCTTSC